MITITREELYEEVWKKPITTLATEYGLSDVGLAKVCKRHSIPMPGRGYWTKKAHGKKLPKKPKLPKLSDKHNHLLSVQIHPKDNIHQQLPIIDEITAFEKDETNKITVDFEADLTHPIVIKTAKSLKSSKENHKGLHEPKAKNCLSISICRDSIDRSLHIMDALLLALDERGATYTTVHDRYYDADLLAVVLDGISLIIKLEENVKRVKHIFSEAEERRVARDHWYRFKLPEYDYIPTGELTLKLDSAWRYDGRKSWSDAKVQRIENHLNDFIITLQKAAIKLRQLDEEDKQREFKRKLAKQKKQEFELAKSEEQKKFDNLLKDCENWHLSQQLREYIDAIKHKSIPKNNDTNTKDWIEWATTHANRLDPTIPSQNSILDYESVAQI